MCFWHRGPRPGDLDVIAKPEGERLLFAGEGTSSINYGNVLAAVLTGLREARRLGEDKFGVDKFGVDKFGVDKFGVDKFGVDKFGVDKFGVDKFGVPRWESY